MNGLDEFREWLQANGFKIERNNLNSSLNECDWIAYRRTTGQTRECETNEGKLQIVVHPHLFSVHGKPHSSVETEITGEADGRWYKLQQYGTSPAEFMENLPDIEKSLINAWNAVMEVA